MESKGDTLLGLRWSCDDSSSVSILLMLMQPVFISKSRARPRPDKPHSPLGWREKRRVLELCRVVQEVIQPFSGGLAKSAALRRQSFMAALFHLQESNCGLSAQVILPTVSPSHAFKLWLICGLRPPLSSSAQPRFSLRNPAGSCPNASCRTGTPCSLDLWPQCVVLVWVVCGSLFFCFLFPPPFPPLSFLFFVHPKIAPPL